MIDSPYEHHHHLPPPWHGDKSRQFSEMAGQSAQKAEESESNAKEAADSAEESRQRAKAYMHYAAHAMLDTKKEISKLDGYDFDAILERLEDVEKKANAAALAASKSFEDVARANIEIRNFVEQTKKEIEDAVDAASGHAGDAHDSADDAAHSAEEAADISQLTTFREFLSQTRLAAEQSATSASAASDSKEDAAESAEQARQYAESVTTAETSALDAAENAKTSAQQAAASAATFAQYTTRAETAATKAETAQGKAEDAQSAAETASGDALRYRDRAMSAYDDANTAMEEAERQKGLAQGYAQDAAQSESNAATSATNAANAAATAATNAANAVADELSDYADRAETAASNAQTYRNQAEGFSSAASTSATNAQTSATTAQTSATNAQTSETNAANSATAAASSADNAARSEKESETIRDELLQQISPAIPRTSVVSTPLVITDAVPNKPIEALTENILPNERHNIYNPLDIEYTITPTTQASIVVNSEPKATVFIGEEGVYEGKFDFISGKLATAKRVVTLDGTSSGKKFIAKRSIATVDAYSLDGFDDVPRPVDDDTDCDVLCTHCLPSSLNALKNYITPPTVTLSSQATEEGETISFTIDYHTDAHAHANNVANYVYVRSDTLATVSLAVNSTNFKMPTGNKDTTGTIRAFPLNFTGLGWAILFDNCMVPILPMARDDYHDFVMPNIARQVYKDSMIAVYPDATQDPVIIGFSKSLGFDTVDKANAWLASCANNGNPVRIAYQLSQPEIHQYSAREITMLAGENVFQTAAPNTLTVKYRIKSDSFFKLLVDKIFPE